MLKGFLLLASYRSGSTWLVDVLNHVEGTAAFGELFAVPEKQAGTEELTRDQALKTTRYLDETIRAYPLYYQNSIKRGLRPFSTFSYLDAFYEREVMSGFKLMYTQLAYHPEIWAYVRLKGISVLHLVRKNHLDVVISREMRKVTKTTHRVAGAKELKRVQVTLEPNALIKKMRSLQRHIDMARGLIKVSRVPSLEIIYEDLSRDPSCFEPVWAFLQINPTHNMPQSNLVKLVRAGYPESIANFEEVRTALQGTEFECLIEG